MTVLGIELSSLQGSLSLVCGQKVLIEKKIRGVLEHDKNFIPLLDSVLKESGVAFSRLKGIGVSVGPGSFTGIRLGIAAAYGLAFKNNIPIVGIPTMEVLVKGEIAKIKEEKLILTPVIQAKRDKFFVGLYKKNKRNDLVNTQEPFLSSSNELLKNVTKTNFIFGIGVEVLKEKLSRLKIKPVFPRAANTALLAESRLASRRYIKKNIKPIYIWEFVPSAKRQFTK